LYIGPFLKVFSGTTAEPDVLRPAAVRIPGPKGPFDDPTVAMALDVSGSAFTYNVRIKHAAGQDTSALPSFDAPAGGLARLGKLAYLLVALMAAAAGVAVYAWLQYWLGRRGETT